MVGAIRHPAEEYCLQTLDPISSGPSVGESSRSGYQSARHRCSGNREIMPAHRRPPQRMPMSRVEDGRGGCAPRSPLRFPSPLISRVEDWRAGLGRSLCCLFSRPFVCECHTISTMPRFQPPPRRTQHADFLALRSPVCFASRLMDLSCRGDFRQRSSNPVAVEQPQGFVQPLPTPPLPAEAFSILSPPHMAPDLLFHPVFDKAEALAGMPDREVIHPTAQHRVDQLYNPAH